MNKNSRFFKSTSIFLTIIFLYQNLAWTQERCSLAPDAAQRLATLRKTLPVVEDPDAAAQEFKQGGRFWQEVDGLENADEDLERKVKYLIYLQTLLPEEIDVRCKAGLKMILREQMQVVFGRVHRQTKGAKGALERKISARQVLWPADVAGLPQVRTDFLDIDLSRLCDLERYRSFGKEAVVRFITDLEVAACLGLVDLGITNRGNQARPLSCRKNFGQAFCTALGIKTDIAIFWCNWLVLNYYLRERGLKDPAKYQGDQGQILFIEELIAEGKLDFPRNANLRRIFQAFPEDVVRKELYWRNLQLPLAEAKVIIGLTEKMHTAYLAGNANIQEAEFSLTLAEGETVVLRLADYSGLIEGEDRPEGFIRMVRFLLERFSLSPQRRLEAIHECFGAEMAAVMNWRELIGNLADAEYCLQIEKMITHAEELELTGRDDGQRRRLPIKDVMGVRGEICLFQLLHQEAVAGISGRLQTVNPLKFMTLFSRGFVERMGWKYLRMPLATAVDIRKVVAQLIELRFAAEEVRAAWGDCYGPEGISNLITRLNKGKISVRGEEIKINLRGMDKERFSSAVDFEEAVLLGWPSGTGDQERRCLAGNYLGRDTVVVPAEKLGLMRERLIGAGAKKIVEFGYQPAEQSVTSSTIANLRFLPSAEVAQLQQAVFLQPEINPDYLLAQWVIKNWSELADDPDRLAFLQAAAGYVADEESGKEVVLNQILAGCLRAEASYFLSFDTLFQSLPRIVNFLYPSREHHGCQPVGLHEPQPAEKLPWPVYYAYREYLKSLGRAGDVIANELPDQHHQGLGVRHTSRFYAPAAQCKIAGAVYEGLPAIDRCLSDRQGYRREPVVIEVNATRINLLVAERFIHAWKRRLPLPMLTEYLEAAIRQDQALMGRISVLNDERLKLILLDKSPYAGADCQRNGLIGVPGWIFEVKDNDVFRVLFQGVAVHELYHEASPLAVQIAERQNLFEKKRLSLDVKLFFSLVGGNLEIIKKIGKSQILDPEAPLLRALMRREFLERIRRVSINHINCRVKPKRTLQCLLMREKKRVYYRGHPVPEAVSQAEIARRIREGKPIISEPALFQGTEPIETDWGLIDLRRLNRLEEYREFGRFASVHFVRDLEIAHYAGLIQIDSFSQSLSCSSPLARALNEKLAAAGEIWPPPVLVSWSNWAVINHYLKIIVQDENAIEFYQGDRGQIRFVQGLRQLGKLSFLEGRANLGQIFTAFPDKVKDFFQWHNLKLPLADVETKEIEELTSGARWRSRQLNEQEARFCRQLEVAVQELKGTRNRLILSHGTLPAISLCYEECQGMKGWVRILELIMLKGYAVNGIEGTLREKLPDRVLTGFSREFIAEMGWRYRATDLTKLVALRQVIDHLLMIRNRQVGKWEIIVTNDDGRVRKRLSCFLGERILSSLQRNKIAIVINGGKFNYDFRGTERNDLLAVIDFEEAVLLNWVSSRGDYLWKKLVPDCKYIGVNTLLVPEQQFVALHERFVQVGCRTIVDLDSHRVTVAEQENKGQANVLNQRRHEENGCQLGAVLRAYRPQNLAGNTVLYEFDHHFYGDESLRRHTTTSLVVAYLTSLGERRLAEELPRLQEAVFIQSHMDQDGFLAQWIIKHWEELSAEKCDFLCALVYYADNYEMRMDIKGNRETEGKIRLLNDILFAWLHQGKNRHVSFDIIFRNFMEIFRYVYNENPTLAEARLKLNYFQDPQAHHRLATIFNWYLQAKAESRERLLQPGVVTVDCGLARVITEQEINYLDCIEFFSDNGIFANAQIVLYICRENGGNRVSVRLLNGCRGLEHARQALNRREKELGGSADWGGSSRALSCFLTGPSRITPAEIEEIIRRELSLPAGIEVTASV